MNFRTRGSLFRALLIGFSVTLDSLCEIKNQRDRPVELYVHFSTFYSLFSAEISHSCGFYRKKQLRKMGGEQRRAPQAARLRAPSTPASASQLLAFSPGKEQAAGVWET